MTTLSNVRQAIYDTIAAIPNIGVVHDYERYAALQSDFKKLYTYNNQILGWNIRRVSQSVTSQAIGRRALVNTWRINGYMSLEDESQTELAFDNLIEEIVSAFAADESLGGVVASTVVDNIAGIQLEDSGPVMMSGVLCHSCRLELRTRHYE